MLRRGVLSVGVVGVGVGVVYSTLSDRRTFVVPAVAQIISLDKRIPKIKDRIQPLASSNQQDYHTVSLGPENDVKGNLTRNSIMLLPSFLTPRECKELIADTEQSYKDGVAVEDDEGLARVQVQDLGRQSQQMDATIRTRLLAFLESALPSESALLFGVETTSFRDLTPSYSSLEPAVNRYTAGGSFEAHEDGYSITINILLDNTSFQGGGTEFWTEVESSSDFQHRKGPALRIEPVAPGCAVLFNGNVRHQGKPVNSGVRYLYVASFDLC